jgi:5-(carboxyamino)imidazole ribonucleotide mutase
MAVKITAMVQIILGSNSDEDELKNSGALDILNQCDVSWDLSILSAHRHPEELEAYCQEAIAVASGTKIFIAAAGMSAVLPGVIAANIKFSLPVIGVALPSSEFPNAIDALLAITRMPGGCPVIFAGIGKAGLKNAALIAVQILSLQGDIFGDGMKKKLTAYFETYTKQPQIRVKTNVKEEEEK